MKSKNRRAAGITLAVVGIAAGCGYFLFWRMDRDLTRMGNASQA